MIIFNLQKRFLKGRLVLPIISFICLAIWIVCNLLKVSKDASSLIYISEWPIAGNVDELNSLLSQISAFAGYFFIGYLLIIFNNVFSIINQRATVQSSIYLLLVTSIPQLHYLNTGLIATIFTLACCYFLFKTYKVNNAPKVFFYVGLFWGLSFLTIPKLILIYPLFLISAGTFGSLNFKTFIASTLGFLFPLWLHFSYSYITGDIELFYSSFYNLFSWSNIIDSYKALSIQQYTSLAFILILVLASSVYMLLPQSKMRIKTYYILNFFFIISIGLTTLTLIDPLHVDQYIPLYLASICFILSNALFTYQNKVSNIIFIIFIIMLIGILYINIWIPLYNF